MIPTGIESKKVPGSEKCRSRITSFIIAIETICALLKKWVFEIIYCRYRNLTSWFCYASEIFSSVFKMHFNCNRHSYRDPMAKNLSIGYATDHYIQGTKFLANCTDSIEMELYITFLCDNPKPLHPPIFLQCKIIVHLSMTFVPPISWRYFEMGEFDYHTLFMLVLYHSSSCLL